MSQLHQIQESIITITFTLDRHGEHQVKRDCDLCLEDLAASIQITRNAFLQSVSDVELDGADSAPLTFSISLWWLEEETLMDSTNQVGGIQLVSSQGELEAACQELINQVLPRFRETLEKNEVGFSDC